MTASTGASSVRGRASGREKGRNLFGYTLLAPQMIGFTAVGVVAIVWVIWLSVHDVNVLAGTQEFIGLENYSRILTDPSMITVLPNTFFFVCVLSIAGTIIALLLALLLDQALRGINIFRSIIFIPALVTMVAWALVWSFIVQPDGLLDALLGAVGIDGPPWLRGGWLTLVVFALIQLTKNVGINVMILLGALQAVPHELVEAGRIDGAGPPRILRSVVIPQISPAILMVFMLTVVGSFKVFEVVMLLTEGGPGVQSSVLAFEVYKQGFLLNDIGYASALAVLLFVLILLLTAAIWQARKRVVFHEND
ncbi:carbohydrate ABC transporter permease [Brachybacterium sacelli]|uniref:Multiple sugar transport system permease protein n=1 Tax=Brachybacterium sacelli TaxID=173364 RepID=A0ABS4WZA8_9MICO|nr:sugar ABC transporter permease [Brachybacterium sacelli]MBP2381431.1 multiple sugar transport system permease protein [Brachybacterium sacelli]